MYLIEYPHVFLLYYISILFKSYDLSTKYLALKQLYVSMILREYCMNTDILHVISK